MTQRVPSLWEQQVAENPDHSQWYIERFRKLAADGVDIFGEARTIDAMLPREGRVLDAGCGPGRLGGYLHRVGHTVVGVDVDAALIEAAEQDYPGPRWIAADLTDLDDALEPDERFDVIVCAGNVLTFLAPVTRGAVLAGFARHLSDQGRLVTGFGAGRDYPFEEFARDAAAAGLLEQGRFATWGLHPFTADSDFLVATFTAAPSAVQ